MGVQKTDSDLRKKNCIRRDARRAHRPIKRRERVFKECDRLGDGTPE
jgi:hypothetical protein